MKYFSSILKSSIEEQGFTIRKLATLADIDRSFLYSILNGKKKLPKSKFGNLVNSSFFNPQQISELTTAFFAECYGSDKQQVFEAFGNHLSGEFFQKLKATEDYDDTDFEFDKVISGQKKLYRVLYKVLSIGTDYFASNFSFADSEINRIVYNHFKDNPISEFYHFIAYKRSSDVYNVDNLFNSTYYSEINCHTYSLPDDPNYLKVHYLPYFFITDKYLVKFSLDLSDFIVSKCEKNLEKYKNHIKKLSTECTCNCAYNPDPFKSMEVLYNFTCNRPLQIGFSTNALASCIDSDIIPVIATDEIKQIDGVVERLEHHFDMMHCNTNDVTLIVTYESLVDFATNGIIGDFPGRLANPVPYDLRCKYFERLLNSNYKVFITNPNEITFSHVYELDINTESIVVSSTRELTGPFAYSCESIYKEDNKIVYNDFLDYLDFMIYSHAVFDEEASKKILEQYILKLKTSTEEDAISIKYPQ